MVSGDVKSQGARSPDSAIRVVKRAKQNEQRNTCQDFPARAFRTGNDEQLRSVTLLLDLFMLDGRFEIIRICSHTRTIPNEIAAKRRDSSFGNYDSHPIYNPSSSF
jgi:hypothetical protein